MELGTHPSRTNSLRFIEEIFVVVVGRSSLLNSSNDIGDQVKLESKDRKINIMEVSPRCSN